MPEKTVFGRAMRVLMSERYELQQTQRRVWKGHRKTCPSYVEGEETPNKSGHLCKNKGHKDYNVMCSVSLFKCHYKLCPFLKGTI